MYQLVLNIAILFLLLSQINVVAKRSLVMISPIIGLSNVFEHCILRRFQSLFSTSKNQFGFKKRNLL